MVSAYAKRQYEEMKVQTTPGRLVVMLYDGALRFLHLGLDALRRSDYEAQALNMNKVQNILSELCRTLNPEAGELAHHLHSIYSYCQVRLLVANAEDNAAYVEEVIGLLSELRDAWNQAERMLQSGQAPQLAGAAP